MIKFLCSIQIVLATNIPDLDGVTGQLASQGLVLCCPLGVHILQANLGDDLTSEVNILSGPCPSSL